MPAINLPDGTLYYAQSHPDATAFPPLVLVHGAGGSRLDWAPELRRLPDARVIALDLPGHGQIDRARPQHLTPTRATSRRCWTRWLRPGGDRRAQHGRRYAQRWR